MSHVIVIRVSGMRVFNIAMMMYALASRPHAVYVSRRTAMVKYAGNKSVYYSGGSYTSFEVRSTKVM